MDEYCKERIRKAAKRLAEAQAMTAKQYVESLGQEYDKHSHAVQLGALSAFSWDLLYWLKEAGLVDD